MRGGLPVSAIFLGEKGSGAIIRTKKLGRGNAKLISHKGEGN